ncbi:hypothetical protein [Nannocystis pusilla]|uniref:hypothetical protein n=1 Tax=Nannocystis pusilla TaxID=889268 RepID=UPI003DA6933C
MAAAPKKKSGSTTKKAAGAKKPTSARTGAAKKPTSAGTGAAKKPASARTSAAKKPAAAKPVPALTIDELLTRSRSIASEIATLHQAAAFEAAARRCVAAGRPDLAAALAEAVPEALRGPALTIAAAGGAGSVDAAINVFKANMAGDDRARPQWAARAFTAARDLAGVTPRAAELAQLARAVLDEAVAGVPTWGEDGRFRELVPLLTAQLAAGDATSVRRILEIWQREDPDSLAEILQYTSPLLWIAPDDPKTTLTLLEAMEPFQREYPLDSGDRVRALAGWPAEQLHAFVGLAPRLRPDVARHLVAAGREADARNVLFAAIDDDEGDDTLAEYRLIVGDTEIAKELVVSGEWSDDLARTRLKIELGVESIADARERLRKIDPRTGGSVMSPVHLLCLLGDFAFARGEHDELPPILKAIDALLASPKRTQYDQGVEGDRRSYVADLRARIVANAGNASATRAALEADLAALPTLQRFGRDTYGRNQITASLMRRAIRHGQPDLALKIAKKITPAERSGSARQVAAAFLPADPAGALAALDALAADRADAQLLAHAPGETDPGTRLLPRLWDAVLAAAAPASAA